VRSYVDGDGTVRTKHVIVRPAHIILATGTLGPPSTPSFDRGLFSGPIMHSSSYKDLTLTGKRLLVVGSGNTAVDIALAFAPDLATLGAAVSEPNQLLHATPTILQRSPTPVLFPRAYEGFFAAACPPGPPLGPMGVSETADFKMASVPWAMREASVRKMRNEAKTKTKANLAEEAQAGTKTEGIAHAKLEEVDEDTRRKNGLKANGFRVGEGPRGLGAAGAVYERFAGYSMYLKMV
jgi:hypothetical protein